MSSAITATETPPGVVGEPFLTVGFRICLVETENRAYS
jgi:hypothetical protein